MIAGAALMSGGFATGFGGMALVRNVGTRATMMIVAIERITPRYDDTARASKGNQ
jgi:hypothetical protein